LETNIERSKKASYEGYGLRVIGVGTKTNTSVDTNSQSSTEDSKPKTNEDSKSVQQIKLTAGQETAKKAILNFIKTADASKGEYFTLTGKAGTGKTTLIQEVIREIAKDNPYQRFVVSALAHKAVQVIYGKTKKSSKFVSASTVASLLGMKLDQETGKFKQVKSGKSKIKPGSILFVDEASMLNEQNIECLIDAAISSDSKVIFLGDPGQLPPIRTGDLVKYGTDSLSPVFKTQKDEYSAGLTERIRQGEGSPILDYADTFWNYSTTEG
jgi:tRNA(Met) C34 N-acetyltransferase TmcA